MLQSPFVTEDRSVLTRAAPAPELVLPYGDAPDQLVEAWPGEASAARRPLVVLIHGGFWRPAYDRTHLRPLANAVRDAGWTVASIEYRREPGRPDLTVEDVRAALAEVHRMPRHGEGVVVAGHSAGGHLALLAASAAPAPGLLTTIALAPVADLAAAHRLNLGGGAVADFLGASAADRADLDPVRLPAPRTPVTVVHGADDAVVPIEQARAYRSAHPGARVVTVPGVAHFALIDPLSPAWPTIRAQLDLVREAS